MVRYELLLISRKFQHPRQFELVMSGRVSGEQLAGLLEQQFPGQQWYSGTCRLEELELLPASERLLLSELPQPVRSAPTATSCLKLYIRRGPDAGAWIALSKGEHLIGRTAPLWLEDPLVSRIHAKLSVTTRGLHLSACANQQIAMPDGSRYESVDLEQGSRFILGHTEFAIGDPLVEGSSISVSPDQLRDPSSAQTRDGKADCLGPSCFRTDPLRHLAGIGYRVDALPHIERRFGTDGRGPCRSVADRTAPVEKRSESAARCGNCCQEELRSRTWRVLCFRAGLGIIGSPLCPGAAAGMGRRAMVSARHRSFSAERNPQSTPQPQKAEVGCALVRTSLFPQHHWHLAIEDDAGTICGVHPRLGTRTVPSRNTCRTDSTCNRSKYQVSSLLVVADAPCFLSPTGSPRRIAAFWERRQRIVYYLRHCPGTPARPGCPGFGDLAGHGRMRGKLDYSAPSLGTPA